MSNMAYEVFYTVGEVEDSIVIEGESVEEIREYTRKELSVRNATYRYSNWLNDWYYFRTKALFWMTHSEKYCSVINWKINVF